MNTPAKAPLTREQIIARAAELGIAGERLHFFDEDTLTAQATYRTADGRPRGDAGGLADYTDLTDVALRSVREPAEGLFIAESSKIIRRAHAAGMTARSFLTSPKWLFDLADLIAAGDAPIHIGTDAAVESLTGFHLHRGALAAMHRPSLPLVTDLLAEARRVVVIEDVVDHTNVGAIFRSAAAFGVDAVLVTPRCADPLYRRAIRVSMGTVFQVPWTRIDPWPGGVETAGARLPRRGPRPRRGFRVDPGVRGRSPGAHRRRLRHRRRRTGPGNHAASDSTVMIPMSGESTPSTSPPPRRSRASPCRGREPQACRTCARSQSRSRAVTTTERRRAIRAHASAS